jgi:DNA topoisomerase-2
MTQIEHILKRPDSYIGSVELITATLWVYDEDTKRMVHRSVKFKPFANSTQLAFREVQYVPGFFKIVDEILVNAADNKVRLELIRPLVQLLRAAGQ